MAESQMGLRYCFGNSGEYRNMSLNIKAMYEVHVQEGGVFIKLYCYLFNYFFIQRLGMIGFHYQMKEADQSGSPIRVPPLYPEYR